MNREWERTLGWSLEEIRSRDNVDILAENYPDPEYREQVRDFVANSNAEWADFKTTVRDGRVIDTSWAMLHLPDGTGIGIGQDITKRKRAEEALRESEERFRAAGGKHTRPVLDQDAGFQARALPEPRVSGALRGALRKSVIGD